MVSEGTRKNGTLICVPIMGESIDKMKIDMHKAKASGADLVEIRLDSLKNFNHFEDLNSLIKERTLPAIFTYRFGVLDLCYSCSFFDACYDFIIAGMTCLDHESLCIPG